MRPLYWTVVVVLAAQVSISAQGRPPEQVSTPLTWLIFVDDLHLDFRNTGRLRDALKTIAAELIKDGDRVAMASSGPSRVNLAATTDRALLSASIRNVVGNALKFEDMQPPYGSAEAFYRASVAATSAKAMLGDAASGPRAMVYVSNGSPFNAVLDPPVPPRPPGRGFDVTRAQVSERLAELIATATQASVPIFAITPRLPSELPSGTPTDAAWEAYLLARQTMLQTMAEETKGFASVGGELVTVLRRIDEAVRR
jgi:hypothetical protein